MDSCSAHSYSFQFPEDIERHIFEQAASDHNTTAFQLSLVARRIQQWVEPILYESLSFGLGHRGPSFDNDRAKPPEFYAKYTKELIINTVHNDCATGSLGELVDKFGLKWTSSTHPFDTVFGAIRPRHVTICSDVVEYLHSEYFLPEPVFEYPFYSKVTHLYLMVAWRDAVISLDNPWLNLLPSLTHLATEIWVEDPGYLAVIQPDLAARVLSACISLEVLVIRVFDDSFRPGQTGPFVDDIITDIFCALQGMDDPRMVVVAATRSKVVSEEIQGLWPQVEAHVQKRKLIMNTKSRHRKPLDAFLFETKTKGNFITIPESMDSLHTPIVVNSSL